MYHSRMTTALQELETLSIAERVQIVEDLWDSIARSNANLPVPQWQKDELARRKERYLRSPDSGETWDQVRQSILQPK
jgi:putative addiction module component (TIGR02574 family)